MPQGAIADTSNRSASTLDFTWYFREQCCRATRSHFVTVNITSQSSEDTASVNANCGGTTTGLHASIHQCVFDSRTTLPFLSANPQSIQAIPTFLLMTLCQFIHVLCIPFPRSLCSSHLLYHSIFYLYFLFTLHLYRSAHALSIYDDGMSFHFT